LTITFAHCQRLVCKLPLSFFSTKSCSTQESEKPNFCHQKPNRNHSWWFSEIL